MSTTSEKKVARVLELWFFVQSLALLALYALAHLRGRDLETQLFYAVLMLGSLVLAAAASRNR